MSNFLTLLPKDVRHIEHSSWYQNQSAQLSDYLQRNIAPFDQPTSVVYKTADPKRELLDMIKDKLAPVLDNRFEIVETGFGRKNEALLNQVNLIKGEGLRHVPQLVMIMIEGENGEEQLFTMIHNNAHSNISSLFNEEGNRDYANDDLTSYEALWEATLRLTYH